MEELIKKLNQFQVNFPYGEFNDVEKIYEFDEGLFVVNHTTDGTYEVYYGTPNIESLIRGLKQVKKSVPSFSFRYGKPYDEIHQDICLFEKQGIPCNKIHVGYKLDMSTKTYKSHPELDIEPLKKHEIDAIMELEQSIFDAYHVSKEDYRNWIENDDHMILTLKKAGDLIGFIILEIYGDQKENLFIRNLAIKEAYRTKRYGQYLLEHALKMMEDIDIKRSMLWVDDKNIPAIKLYEKMCYVRDEQECEAIFQM